jgi:phosphoglycerate dehydrogenase-like enzyme
MLVWLPQPALADRLGPLAGVEVDVLLDWDGQNVPSSADAVEVVVPPPTYRGDLAPLFRRLPRLRIVQTLSAGVDRVVTAVPDAVHVINARGLHTPSTAEWVCAAILACQRELPDFVRAQQAARWSHHGTRTLDGATVLLIGSARPWRSACGRSGVAFSA